MLVAFAQDIEKARRVVADLLAQLAQRDEFAGAGGHRRLLAVAIKHRELDQGDGELVGIQADGLQRALYPRDVAMVIGAPDVDDPVESAVEFVQVIGDVGSEVGVLAVFTLHDAILLVAVVGGTEPLRPLPSRTGGRFYPAFR